MLDKMQDKTLLKVEGLTKNFGGVAAIVKVSSLRILVEWRPSSR